MGVCSHALGCLHCLLHKTCRTVMCLLLTHVIHAAIPCHSMCMQCMCLRLPAHLGIHSSYVVSLIRPSLPCAWALYFRLAEDVMMSAAELGWLMSVNCSLFMVVSMGCRACSSRAGHAVPGELHADLLLAEPHGCHPFPRKLSTACGGLLLDCPGCHVSALQCKRNGARVLQPS